MHSVVRLLVFISLNVCSFVAFSQTTLLTLSNVEYEVSNVFSDVDTFEFSIEINEPLATGLFENPQIISIRYLVTGNLTEGTPSGFPAFRLEREISGTEFYAQGSSLQFEVAATAVLQDGIQISELAGSEMVLRLDAREIDNTRFHPPVVVLNSNGTGRIQNSNNVPTLDPLLEVEPGSEYINDLIFDPGNTTLLVSSETTSGSSGGGSTSLSAIWLLLIYGLIRTRSATA